jgi:ketosteroid isomerase-like protein
MPFLKLNWRTILQIALITIGLGGAPQLSLTQTTHDSHAKDQAAITQLLKKQQADWNKGDVDAFMSAYWKSSHLTFVGASGLQRGYDAVYARYKKSYPDGATMGHLDFSELEFHFTGNDGVLVIGHWHLTRDKEKGDIGGLFSLVWQRFPEGWRIIHDHTSAFSTPK